MRIFHRVALLVASGGLGVYAAGSGHKITRSITTPVVTPPVIQCPDDYRPEANKCVRQIVQPLVPTCTEGILQPDQTCLIILPPQKLCPPEFVLSGGGCMRSATAPAALSCPPEFVFEPGHKKSASICTRATQGPAVNVCPPGALTTPEGCVVESIVLPAITCPEGTLLQGQVCIRLERYECQPALTGNKHKNKRLLQAVDDTEALERYYSGGLDGEGNADQRQLGHTPKKIKAIDNDYVAISIVGQQCERRIAVPPLLQCPFNSVLLGRECVTTAVVSPIVGPPAINVETAPPVASCPPTFAPCGGFKVSKKHPHECCSAEEAPFTFGCPNGFVFSADTCQAFRPAELICANTGFSKHKHRSECIRTQYVEPIITYTAQISCVGQDCNGKQKHQHHNY